jgi:sec-independent protein translocase protein TatA
MFDHGIGGWEIVLILVLFMVLFGAKRLPDSARALGRSMRIFKSEVKGMHDDDQVGSAVPPTGASGSGVPPVAPPAALPASPPPAASYPPPAANPPAASYPPPAAGATPLAGDPAVPPAGDIR